MKVIGSIRELDAGNRKVCLGMGFFDGVHLGHQQIVRQTVADARKHQGLALILTFDRHPNTVVAPERVPQLIFPLRRKIETLGTFGADYLLLIHFDKPFSLQSGEEFIQSLTDVVPLQSICVGANFVFGHHRSGNVELLKQIGQRKHFSVHGVAAVSLDGVPVSSTRIRKAIAAGNMDGAAQMLGREYCLEGPVLHGDELGRKLGFPTANLDVTGLVIPPRGVYAVRVSVGERSYNGVLNIGLRPTLRQTTPQMRAEVHLLDFTGDLYGRELAVYFLEKLRDEIQFSSVEKLQAQIMKDVAAARARF